ncbi:MAG TPA: flagellar hook-associated protein FlgL, partial [Burkholderiaceae bacterium]|nr:flagellar hook-associated protein FlgL [Burkholderiaceae bacterium]
ERVSTANAYSQAIGNLMSRQVSLTNAQMQLTSGKRVNQASDDPTAAARAERARAEQAATTASERAVDASTNAMTLTESALGDAGDLLGQIRQLVVQAGDASYSDPERASIAQQISSLRDEMLSVSNQSDGNGGYLFSGQGTGSQPFVDQPGGVAFTGTGGQTSAGADNQLPLALDGKSIWLQGSTGNGVFETKNVNSASAWIDSGSVTSPTQITGSTYDVQFSTSGGQTTYSILKDGQATSVSNAAYTSGQQIAIDGMSFSISGTPNDGDHFQIAPSQKNLSVFDAIDKIVKELKTPGQTGTQVTQDVQSGMRDIDQAQSQLSSARSYAGTTLSRLDGVKSRLTATNVAAQTTESNSEDLDMVSALSSFQSEQTGYSAALQSYASIQKMSLFNYIST